jgi:hypothetical protein
MISKKTFLLSITLLLFNYTFAQDLFHKANVFLNSLSDDLKSKAYYTLDDPERFNIQFVPIARKGASFHDFNDEQKKLALDLLRAELEKVLIVVENNRNKMPDGSPMRDPLKYYIWVFGDPSQDNFWGWRFEGHHLSLSFTSNDNQLVSSTPSFFGSNPAIVNVDGFDHQEVLKLETHLGFKMVNSLNKEQLAIALFSNTAPKEIITRNNRKAETMKPVILKLLEGESSRRGLRTFHLHGLEVYNPVLVIIIGFRGLCC